MDLFIDGEREEQSDKDYSADLDSEKINNAEVQTRIKRNQISMMKTRGYVIEKSYAKKEKEYESKITYRSIVSKMLDLKKKKKTLKEDMSVGYIKPKEDEFGRKVLVKFLEYPLDKKSGKVKKEPKETITNVFREISNTDYRHIILISLFGLSPSAKTEINKLVKIRFEIFTVNEMKYNPINHFLAPEYKLLNKKEWSTIKEKSKINENNIPKMIITGRIPRYYGASIGQIFELKYKTPIPNVAFTSKYSHIEYRRVIDNS